MLSNLQKYDIVLASASPRRRELLSRLGVPFKIRTLHGIDESFPPSLRGEDIVRYIARAKAAAYRKGMAPGELLITADTIVCLSGKVMGKPADEAEARAMLTALQGEMHQVFSGVIVQTAERTEEFAVCTHVRFAPLSEEEIDYYVSNFLPFDKAGAYGIQEWIGLAAVEEIRGSYFNVMGLPIHRLYQLLKTF